MNADDRTPPPGQGLYTPRPADSQEGALPARRAFMPVTTEQPTSGESPVSSAPESAAQAPAQPAAPARPQAQAAAPTTGSVPQRTPLRPQSAPSGIPTSPAFPPAEAPRAPQATGVPGATTASSAPTAAAAPPATPPTPPTAPISTGAPVSTGAPLADSGARFDGAIGAGTAAFGAGTARLKGLAGRAAESFKAGDDLATPSSKGGPRKARVLLSRIDPWSALKIGFLLSIALGIMLVVAVFVLWNVLNGMGVFALVNEWVQKLFTNDQELNIMQFFDRNKVMSATILVSVVNVVLLTALATVTAFLYNIVSSVVGGVYVTLTDD